MTKQKKVNPRKRPATQADVKKAKNKATEQAVIATKVINFTALLDEGIIKPEDVKRGWEKTNYLAESVLKGYCSLQDMYNTLIEECGVDLGE